MNIFYLIDNQNHTAYETESRLVGQLASELGVTGNYTAAIGSRNVSADTELQANDAVSFVTEKKTGGK